MERNISDFSLLDMAKYTDAELEAYLVSFNAAIGAMMTIDLESAIAAENAIREELNKRKS